MTRSHFIEILTILTKYLLDLGVRLTEFSVTVESVTLRFYCIHVNLVTDNLIFFFLSNGTAQKMFIKEVQGVWNEAKGLCAQ